MRGREKERELLEHKKWRSENAHSKSLKLFQLETTHFTFPKKTGDRGKNATSLFLVISNPRGFKEGKDSSVEFDATPLSEAKEEADSSDVKFTKGLTRPARIADAENGQKVRLEQVVSMIAAYSPHGEVALKRAKDVVAGTYEKPKATKKAAKKEKKDADDAAAPAPAAAPLAEKVKNTTAAAKDTVVEKAGAAKDKGVEAVGAGRKMLSFADLNPGRRLLQDGPGCGICEYTDKSGACKVAPASLDCDGVVGMSGEWNCGTCESEFCSIFFLFLRDLSRRPHLTRNSNSSSVLTQNSKQRTPGTTSWGTASPFRTARALSFSCLQQKINKKMPGEDEAKKK